MASSPAGTRVGSKSRGRIIEAARALFVEQSYAKTSMAMIGERAGVVRATVYNNFADKIAILAEIIRDYMDGYVRMVAQVRANASDTDTSFQLIEATIRSALAWRAENAELRPLIDIAKHLPDSMWEEANARADAAMLDWLLAIHRRDMQGGFIHAEPAIEFATPVAYGVVDAGLARFNGAATPSSIAIAARKLALVYWHAIYRVAPSDMPPVSPEGQSTRVSRRAGQTQEPS